MPLAGLRRCKFSALPGFLAERGVDVSIQTPLGRIDDELIDDIAHARA